MPLRRFLDDIDAVVPKDLDVHIVLDNYATHKTAEIQRWLAKRPRYHLHFTPTGASWIILVERWFAELTNKQIRRGVHHSTQALEQAIEAYLETHNKKPKPFVWTKSADELTAAGDYLAGHEALLGDEPLSLQERATAYTLNHKKFRNSQGFGFATSAPGVVYPSKARIRLALLRTVNREIGKIVRASCPSNKDSVRELRSTAEFGGLSLQQGEAI